MGRRIFSLLGAAVLAAGAGAGARAETPTVPADGFHAPTADCIWANLPASIRNGVAAARTIDDLSAATAPLDADPVLARRLVDSCEPAPSGRDPADIVRHIIVPKTMEIWAAHRLKAGYRVSDRALAHAWARVPADGRARLAAWFIRNPDPRIAPTQVLRPALAELGVQAAEPARLVLFYAAARALFEQLGGTG